MIYFELTTMRRNGAPQNITDVKYYVIDIGASFETRLVVLYSVKLINYFILIYLSN